MSLTSPIMKMKPARNYIHHMLPKISYYLRSFSRRKIGQYNIWQQRIRIFIHALLEQICGSHIRPWWWFIIKMYLEKLKNNIEHSGEWSHKLGKQMPYDNKKPEKLQDHQSLKTKSKRWCIDSWSVYMGNMEIWLKDLLGTTCLSKILLAANVQLIARITVSWDEILKRCIRN